MAPPDERPSRRGSGRVLLTASLVLAAAAIFALVLGADDARLLRLGIVAALWAALLGAFAAARMRRDLRSDEHHTARLREVYQLELEREVTARREHELTVERELREQAQQAEREEITALRAELAALRQNLQSLMGGDVMVERVALRAESTRLLGLSDSRGAVERGVLPPAATDAEIVTSTDWSSLSRGVPPLGGDQVGEPAEADRATPTYQNAPQASVAPEPVVRSEPSVRPQSFASPRSSVTPQSGNWQRGPLDPLTEPSWRSEQREDSVPTTPRASRHSSGADSHWAPAVSSTSTRAPVTKNGRHGWSSEQSWDGFGSNGSSSNGGNATGRLSTGGSSTGSFSTGGFADSGFSDSGFSDGSGGPAVGNGNGHATQESANGDADVTGSHPNGNAGAADDNGSVYTGTQRRRTTGSMPPQRPGAHTGGLPVVDLLAAHGGGADTPRRRRRREDE